MKIVLVNKFWYARGGAERVVLLTKELLEKAGHTVEVFGMNHPDNLFSNKYFIDKTVSNIDIPFPCPIFIGFGKLYL